jgi:hypothetical protein
MPLHSDTYQHLSLSATNLGKKDERALPRNPHCRRFAGNNCSAVTSPPPPGLSYWRLWGDCTTTCPLSSPYHCNGRHVRQANTLHTAVANFTATTNIRIYCYHLAAIATWHLLRSHGSYRCDRAPPTLRSSGALPQCLCYDRLTHKSQKSPSYRPCHRLVAGLSPQRPGFSHRPVHVGFVVDKVAPMLNVLAPEVVMK